MQVSIAQYNWKSKTACRLSFHGPKQMLRRFSQATLVSFELNWGKKGEEKEGIKHECHIQAKSKLASNSISPTRIMTISRLCF